MLTITNRVHACWDGRYRKREVTSTIMIHRIGPELGDSAVELAKEFKDTKRHAAGSYTGGEFPYHFVLFPDGRVEQALALEDTGVHALVWNRRAIAIACSGNYHLAQDPTPALWSNLVDLSALLAWWLGAYSLVGHTETPHSSMDALKRCPGGHIDMNDLRSQVQDELAVVTPAYNKMAKDLVLAGRMELNNIGGYGIIIRGIGAIV